MRIEKPKKSRFSLRLFFFLFFCALAGIMVAILSNSGVKPPKPYQVQNVIGKVEIYSFKDRAWRSANRGDMILPQDKIQTGPASEIDIYVPDEMRIRIKENSAVETKDLGWFDRISTQRLKLLKGTLMAATERPLLGERIEILVPGTALATSKGSLFAKVDAEHQESWIGVLRGVASQDSGIPGFSKKIQELQRVGKSKKGGGGTKPVEISREEWNDMKEAYELIQKSAAVEALQMDLSRDAGNFFDHVFDHGDFYTPKVGYALREFSRDEVTGNVYLEVEYDVFPTGSFAGMYIKTRDLDVLKFSKFVLEARRPREGGYPNNVKIELKSKSGIVRAFVIKMVKNDWATYEFPLNFKNSTLINEVTLVFANDRVGEHKKGRIQIRKMILEPAKPASVQSVIPKPESEPVSKPVLEQIPVEESPAGEAAVSEKVYSEAPAQPHADVRLSDIAPLSEEPETSDVVQDHAG